MAAIPNPTSGGYFDDAKFGAFGNGFDVDTRQYLNSVAVKRFENSTAQGFGRSDIQRFENVTPGAFRRADQ